MTAAPIPRLRRAAARVALLTADSETLLLRYDNPEVGVHWSLPGGGLEPGESPSEGAHREVREETGWADIEPGPLLCTWEHEFTRGTVAVRQHEHIYVSPAPRRPLSGDLAAAHAADGILAARWWTLAELATATEALWPPTLAALLTDFRANGPRDPAPDLGFVPGQR